MISTVMGTGLGMGEKSANIDSQCFKISPK